MRAKFWQMHNHVSTEQWKIQVIHLMNIFMFWAVSRSSLTNNWASLAEAAASPHFMNNEKQIRGECTCTGGGSYCPWVSFRFLRQHTEANMTVYLCCLAHMREKIHLILSHCNSNPMVQSSTLNFDWQLSHQINVPAFVHCRLMWKHPNCPVYLCCSTSPSDFHIENKCCYFVFVPFLSSTRVQGSYIPVYKPPPQSTFTSVILHCGFRGFPSWCSSGQQHCDRTIPATRMQEFILLFQLLALKFSVPVFNSNL